MPRRARIALPKIPVHLIQRGNNRQSCFFADEDGRGDFGLPCFLLFEQKICYTSRIKFWWEVTMSAVTFDTLKFVERLKAGGISDVQAKAMAEAQVEAFSETTSNSLATKQDVARLELKLTEHDGEFKLIKWMMGLLLGGVAALILKAFF